MFLYRLSSVVLGLFIANAATGQTVIGFRTDGTGRYPAAEPPLAWSTAKNVVWKIPLTQSNAVPVILGDKLFTCAEPCVLLCLNKADGAILWKHESFYKEIEPSEKEKPQIEIESKQDALLAMQQAAMEKELMRSS